MGAAAGAEGPSGKSQHVLGAPWSRGHQPLLGHQRPPSVCGRLWRQSVFSTCGIFQSRQGSACTSGVKKPVSVQILDNCLFVCLCPGPIRHLPCSDRHHGGLQGGSAWLPRWPPVSVFLESLLPLRHREVSPTERLQAHFVKAAMISLFTSVFVFLPSERSSGVLEIRSVMGSTGLVFSLRTGACCRASLRCCTVPGRALASGRLISAARS